MLFCLYKLPLGNIISRDGVKYNYCAEDTQLYISFKPGEAFQLAKLEACLKDVKTGMLRLLLNSDKSAIIIIGSKSLKRYIHAVFFAIFSNFLCNNSFSVSAKAVVKNLGVTIDSELSFQAHMNNITRVAFFHLSHLDAEQMVHAFVTSWFDYCNVLLSGCTN